MTVNSQNKPVRGRFAPSPTGRMHLGNIYAALMSWLYAKACDGRWVLRIEDLDPQRSRREYARLIEDDLRWLGLDWDEGGFENRGDAGPYVQSERNDIYNSALQSLIAQGLVYPCHCTRAEVMATQAPHQSDGRVVYAGTCRPGIPPFSTEIHSIAANLRLYVPDEDITFDDLIAGRQTFNPARDCGDFVLRRRDGAWAYQLAVVVDDALMGITQVVRGDDLLLSTAQQIYLYRLLGFSVPEFAHLPLLKNVAGQRLSKRDGAMAMDVLRQGYSPAELVGYILHLAGYNPTNKSLSVENALEIFRTKLPSQKAHS